LHRRPNLIFRSQEGLGNAPIAGKAQRAHADIQYHKILCEVFVPASTIRPLIVLKEKTSFAPAHSFCPAEAETPKTDFDKTNGMRGVQPRNYSWAQLMMRVSQDFVRLSNSVVSYIGIVGFSEGILNSL
jgi:hypothetical protein